MALRSRLLLGRCSLAGRSLSSLSFKRFGNPSTVLEITDDSVKAGLPASGEVKVAMKAGLVSDDDIASIKGVSFSCSNVPGIGGTVGAGIVSAVASDVTNVAVDDVVVVVGDGLWTTDVVIDASAVSKAGSLKSCEQAAMLAPYISAWAILHNFAVLKSGDKVVQTNGSGVVGKAVSLIGKSLGLEVINLSSEEIADTKLAATLKSQGSIKLAINGLPGSHVPNLLRAVADGGHVVAYNGTTPAVGSPMGAKLPVSNLVFSNASLQGFDLRLWVKSNPKSYQDAVSSIVALNLNLKPSHVCSHVDYRKALKAAGNGNTAILTF